MYRSFDSNQTDNNQNEEFNLGICKLDNNQKKILYILDYYMQFFFDIYLI